MNNNIKLLILSPHSSHFTQPLDIGIFSPLKEYMTQATLHLVSAKVATFQKAEWLEAYVKARIRAFSIQNIFGSWSGAGLIPFSPRKVVRRVQKDTPSPPSSPEIVTTNPFTNTLTNSPINIHAVQAANKALNECLAQIPGVSSPIRNYVQRLTARHERLESRISIVEIEKANTESVLSARKKRESGKRGVLKDRHSVAIKEVLNSIRIEEKRIADQKSKRGKKTATQREAAVEIGNVDEQKQEDEDEPMVEDD
jgi:hypothetical protein